MPWFSLNISDFIKKRVCKFLLNRYLGKYLADNLTTDQICLDLYNGLGSVSDVILSNQVRHSKEQSHWRECEFLSTPQQWASNNRWLFCTYTKSFSCYCFCSLRKLVFLFAISYVHFVCCLRVPARRLCMSRSQIIFHDSDRNKERALHVSTPASDFLVKIVLWLIKLEQRKWFSYIAMARTHTHRASEVWVMLIFLILRRNTKFNAGSLWPRVYVDVCRANNRAKSCFASCFSSTASQRINHQVSFCLSFCCSQSFADVLRKILDEKARRVEAFESCQETNGEGILVALSAR